MNTRLPTCWPKYQLAEVLLGRGTRNGIYKPKRFHGSGVKMVNMGELFAHRRIGAIPMKRIELTDAEQDRFLLRQGDLLFARRSLVAAGAGQCSIVHSVEEPTTFESSIIRARPDPALASSSYLFYLFRSKLGRDLLDSIRRQTAVSGITGTDLVKLWIPLPPIEEQKAIGRIFGALDDKIELNREMNRTLEATAQAIFRSWFVDFDAVVAKADGRKPFGMSDDLDALFPDRFVESDLGPIPEGWEVMKLDEIADVNEESVGRGYPHDEIEYIEISAVSKGVLEGTAKHRLKETPSRAKRIVRHGDTIWSCVRPNREAYLFIFNPSPNTVASTGFAVLTPQAIPASFLYSSVTADSFVGYLTSNAQGSAYPAVKADTFKRADIVVPTPRVLEAFDQMGDPIREKVARNQAQSGTLATLRDLLLPMLLSGEIRVGEAEDAVEAAV